MRMDADLAIRAGFFQGLLVVIIALVMIVLLPGDFFSEWGWLTGPLAWLGCAGAVALRYKLPRFQTLLGAALAGIPMLIALALGAHWAGVVIGLVVFGAWCGALEPLVPRRISTPSRRRHV